MKKFKNKNEVVKTIQSVEMLEASATEVSRNDSSSKQRSEIARFNRQIEQYRKDARDILLIAIEVK